MSDAQRREAADGDLARVIGEGDRLALGELYSRHAGPCFALARRVLADRVLAEEVVQEVFLRLWRWPDRFDPTAARCAPSCSHRCTAVRSTCCAPRPRAAPASEREAFRSPTIDDDLERAVAEFSEGEAVRRALADLSEGERGAIELAYFGGHTYREVSPSSPGGPEGDRRRARRSRPTPTEHDPSRTWGATAGRAVVAPVAAFACKRRPSLREHRPVWTGAGTGPNKHSVCDAGRDRRARCRCSRSGVCLQTPAFPTRTPARRPMRASAATHTVLMWGATAGRRIRVPSRSGVVLAMIATMETGCQGMVNG